MPLSVGIVGAGIGGLTAAAAMAQDGHSVTVYDRFAQPGPVGSGLVIQPVGQDVLRMIGADKTALSHGHPIWRMEGVEVEHGRTVLAVDYGPPDGQRFGLAIQRPALFDAVYGAARAAGVAIQTSREALAASNGKLSFADGVEGPFDLVVDASGANSKLTPLDVTALPFGAIWATVPWQEVSGVPLHQLTQRYRRADRMIGLMPSGTAPHADTNSATIFWSLAADGGYEAWRSKGLAAWRDEVATLWPEVAPVFEQVTDQDQMTFARYSHGTARRPIGDRFAAIGDAAHRASPQLGQGANMAMLDAAALALALRHWPVDQALTHFARARRWHVRLYQAMSWAFTPQYQSDSRVLPILRDRVLAPVSRIPPVPGILTRLVCGDLLPPLASLTPT